ncbi:MAG: hypothetical protein GF329_06865 [Candidatus Lokiarchaeota archaeon]|nr:hypothetical protein [Candidatus Lokiarchaeota archaeon]
MPTYYGDIPDSLRTKQFLPLSINMWPIIRDFGWEYSKKAMGIVFDRYYDIASKRLDEAVFTAKEILKGNLKNPDKIFTFFFFPVVFCIRSDLQMGTTKLLYGESTDTTFILIDDFTGEIGTFFNCHMEDGIPLDYYMVNRNEELLDRRHIKLGYKLKDIPKKFGSLKKSGEKIIDILKDIRNERTPQWKDSAYHIVMVWMSAACNLGVEISNYEAIAGVYDGITSKRKWNLHDNYFEYVPYPPFIGTLLLSPRANFINIIAGLSAGSKLYIQGLGDFWINWMKSDIPEIYETALVNKLEHEGLVVPYQTLNCQLADLNSKDTWEKSKFEPKYPEAKRIFSNDLGMSVEEVLQGVYIDLDNDTPPDHKITEKDIISTGIGRDTKPK